jgi:hypothetical protein
MVHIGIPDDSASARLTFRAHMTGGAFMYVFIVALLAFVLVAPAHAQVHVDIGIHFPAPPRLVVVPEVRAVQYVPAAPANIFLYSGQYWAFANGGWHVSAGYNGPWIVVAPHFVPRPVLLVPANYYRVPPGHWKHWHKRQPPRWGDEWGREWSEKRKWKARKHEREEEHGKGHGPGHGRGKHK